MDDLSQCLYTSGHARHRANLDQGVDYPDDDTAEAIAAFERAIFETAAAALRDPARTESWADVCGSLLFTADDIRALADLNLRSDVVLDAVHVVQCLPSTADVDLLASIPNGYFAADLDPFALGAVIRHPGARHGYRLFGLGAAVVGLSRSEPLDESSLDALIADLVALYGVPEAHEPWGSMRHALAESTRLLLGYTEDFAELVTG